MLAPSTDHGPGATRAPAFWHADPAAAAALIIAAVGTATPQECSGAPQLGGASDLLKRLQSINITRCDEAAWRFLGISLAGYNALISAALTAVALAGARASRARPSRY